MLRHTALAAHGERLAAFGAPNAAAAGGTPFDGRRIPGGCVAPPSNTAGIGFTLVELMLAIALTTVLVGIAVPITGSAIDELRTGAAARYMAGRIAAGRMDAINRSRAVALRFQASTPDYQFAPYVDGNGNGVRSADIRTGIDPPVGAPRQLADDFDGVHFGLEIGVPDVDGVPNVTTDGVRIGIARILTVSPDGTATSGTLYLQGRRAQYAVRVLGATGRTRVLKYDAGARTWISR
jgi:type II secretory pathway pseudopilin PulG